MRKGDYVYVEGKLVSSTYEREYGKGKNKIIVPHKAWQVKAESIRKLNRGKKARAAAAPAAEPQPEEAPF